MPPNWVKIFLRLHRTIPESFPMQSRTIPDTREPSTDNPELITDFFITFFLKKICVYQKKALSLQSKLNKKYHKTENGLDTLQLMSQNTYIMQSICASSLTRGVLFC